MPAVTTRFSTPDPYLFVVGLFQYDENSQSHWDRHMYLIEDALKTSIQHMLRTCPVPDWNRVRKALAALPFVTESKPGLCLCRSDGIEFQYEYAILCGTYNNRLTLSGVKNGPNSETTFEVCYAFSEESGAVR